MFVFQIFCDSNQWTETTHFPKSQFVKFLRVLFAKISQDWGLIFWKVVPNAGEEVSHILKLVREKVLAHTHLVEMQNDGIIDEMSEENDVED